MYDDTIGGIYNEKDNNTISYRLFGSRETTTLSVDEFIHLIKESIEKKLRNL